MFKGKISLYKNIDGKEEKIDREFDNEQDFNNFIRENQIDLSSSRGNIPFIEWDKLDTYLDDFFSRRFPNFIDKFVFTSQNPSGIPIDINKYEQEFNKIEYEKRKKQQKIEQIKKSIDKLNKFKERFKQENKELLIKEIEVDIENLKIELEKLQSEN